MTRPTSRGCFNFVFRVLFGTRTNIFDRAGSGAFKCLKLAGDLEIKLSK